MELARNKNSTGSPWPADMGENSKANATGANSTADVIKSTTTTAITAGLTVEGKLTGSNGTSGTGNTTTAAPRRRLTQYYSNNNSSLMPTLQQPLKMSVPLNLLHIHDDDVTSFFAGEHS
jgi:hypothetical protein